MGGELVEDAAGAEPDERTRHGALDGADGAAEQLGRLRVDLIALLLLLLDLRLRILDLGFRLLLA